MGKASRKKKKPGEAGSGKVAKLSKDLVSSERRERLQGTTSKVTPSLLIIFILFSCFAVYFNSLSNDFVFTDRLQVVENQWIKDIRHIPDIFSTDVWGFGSTYPISNYYRPLMHIIYMLNYHILGLKPWGFHLVNMLFHAGVSILIFIIVLRLFREFQPSATTSYLIPSFMATMLFVTHPIHTEAVTWIAGLPDLTFTFFYLLSFYLYIRSGTEFRSSYFFSVASFFLATLCKEPALTLPGILIVYDYAVKKSEDPLPIQVKRYIPYLIVVGVYFILRFHALTGFAPSKRYAELSIYQDIINIFPLFSQYLQKLILPINLNAFYVFHPIFSITEAKGIITFVIVAAFFIFILISLRRNRAVFLSLLFIVVPLLPVLYIPVLGENSFAERYLYLPSFGFISLFALLLTWAKVNRPKAALGLIVASAILIGLYSLGTVRRNTIWKDDYILFTDTVTKSPDGAIPHYNLGNALFDKGQIDEAIEHYQIALKISPGYVEAHNNLGNALRNKGQVEEAIGHYQIALKINPDDVEAHNNLGNVLFNKGQIDEAIEHYQIALKINPDYVEAHNNLWVALLNKGQIDKAIEHYQKAVRFDPANSFYRYNLDRAYELKNVSRRNSAR